MVTPTEVGQALATGGCVWAMTSCSMQGTPLAHAALEGAAHAGREQPMAAAQLAGHRLQISEQRHDFFRVGATAGARRRCDGLGLDAVVLDALAAATEGLSLRRKPSLTW